MSMSDDRETPRLLRVLAGEAVWPPPVWLMRQAGRYLPEYREIRAQAGDFLTLCRTPDLAAEVTIQPIRRFGMDGAILFSDILIVPWALGQSLRFAEGEGPRLGELNDAADLRLDEVPDRVAPIIQTVAKVRAALERKTTLIGFAGGPFTVACYMVDGRGGEFLKTRNLAYTNPVLLGAIVEKVTQATIIYLTMQIEAGADCVMLFDSWAGLLPPDLFATYVIAPSRRIVEALNTRFPHVKIIGFPRLAGLLAVNYAAQTGVDAMAMDTTTDPALLAAHVPSNLALQGNLDPLLVRAGGPALLAGVSRIARAMHGRPHIFNLGHGILPDTSPSHVADLVGALRALAEPADMST